MIRELEDREFLLHSMLIKFCDGTSQYRTWVTIRKDSFCISYRNWETLEAKDAYVASMRPHFGEVK